MSRLWLAFKIWWNYPEICPWHLSPRRRVVSSYVGHWWVCDTCRKDEDWREKWQEALRANEVDKFLSSLKEPTREEDSTPADPPNSH